MHIEIDKELIPYTFYINLGDIYTFTVRYNLEHDYFTVDLSLGDEDIVIGEKLIYGRKLFSHLDYKDIPQVSIIPYERAEKVGRISHDNLNKKVFLYLGDDYEKI